jgi:hypothetical protein
MAAWSVSAVVVFGFGALPAFAGGGNSDAAHACQKGGYASYTRADGTPFANTGDCVSYAAHGGVLTPVVVKNATTISTSLFRSSISAGSTDYDTATLSGATADAGGHVTYSVYSDSSCSALVQTAGTVLVFDGHVPDSFVVTFPAAGTYYWQASYTGDENNSPAVSDCASEPLVVG